MRNGSLRAKSPRLRIEYLITDSYYTHWRVNLLFHGFLEDFGSEAPRGCNPGNYRQIISNFECFRGKFGFLLTKEPKKASFAPRKCFRIARFWINSEAKEFRALI